MQHKIEIVRIIDVVERKCRLVKTVGTYLTSHFLKLSFHYNAIELAFGESN